MTNREDEKWMADAMKAIEGLHANGPAFTGHPVVDVVSTLRSDLAALRAKVEALMEATRFVDEPTRSIPVVDLCAARRAVRSLLSGGDDANPNGREGDHG